MAARFRLVNCYNLPRLRTCFWTIISWYHLAIWRLNDLDTVLTDFHMWFLEISGICVGRFLNLPWRGLFSPEAIVALGEQRWEGLTVVVTLSKDVEQSINFNTMQMIIYLKLILKITKSFGKNNNIKQCPTNDECGKSTKKINTAKGQYCRNCKMSHDHCAAADGITMASDGHEAWSQHNIWMASTVKLLM